MELDSIKRVFFWMSFFVFVILIALFQTAEKLSFVFCVVLIVLLSFLSSMFRLNDMFSLLSFLVVFAAGFAAGFFLSKNSVEFFLLSFTYVGVFFAFCEFSERKLFEI